MANTIEVKVPDIGGYDDVPVIELLVAVGDVVKKDQGLVTLESDKATMEVPSSAAGKIVELKVKVGDKLSEGSVVAILEAEGAASHPPPPWPRSAGWGTPRQARNTHKRTGRRAPMPNLRPLAEAARRRKQQQAPAARPTSNAACWCSAPAPAVTPPPSAPPTSASTPCWSSATPRSVASASMSAAFRPRRCCTPLPWSMKPRTPRITALISANPRSASTSCANTRTRSSAASPRG